MSDHLPRRTVLAGALAGLTGWVAACSTDDAAPQASSSPGEAGPGSTPSPTPATPAEMAARATVPVLCYHQVRPYQGDDSAFTRQKLVIEPYVYRTQLDAIAEAGYATISPDAYLEHLSTGAQLPAKPVLITFDDGKDNQVDVALPELTARGMTATWFVMTVVIGKPGWVTARQIEEAADAGFTIGGHTWDHHDVREYVEADFVSQLDEARKTLQDASGQPVDTLAFPYGAWNAAALPRVQAAGFTSAFQLDDHPLDPQLPQFTLRRVIVDSGWGGDELLATLAAGPG